MRDQGSRHAVAPPFTLTPRLHQRQIRMCLQVLSACALTLLCWSWSRGSLSQAAQPTKHTYPGHLTLRLQRLPSRPPRSIHKPKMSSGQPIGCQRSARKKMRRSRCSQWQASSTRSLPPSPMRSHSLFNPFLFSHPRASQQSKQQHAWGERRVRARGQLAHASTNTAPEGLSPKWWLYSFWFFKLRHFCVLSIGLSLSTVPLPLIGDRKRHS